MKFPFFEKKPECVTERKSDKEADRAIKDKINLRAVRDKLKTEFFREEETLVYSMARLVFELKDELPNYDTIISDDTSGRLPSLFFKKLIDRERAKTGKRPVNHFFVASGVRHSPGTMSEVRKFLDEKRGGLGRVLVVTEYIYSGKSIAALINVLEDVGIDFDVAAVSTQDRPDDESAYGRDYREMFKKHLYYGDVGNGGLAFYDNPSLSGVGKQKEVDSAHPVKLELENEDRKQEVLASMKMAREDMAMLAEELSKLLY